MTYDVRPKRKNRVFEKIQVWYFYHSVVLFFLILVKRVDHFLVAWVLECSGPTTTRRKSSKYDNFSTFSDFDDQ